MSLLTIEQIDAKIATAQERYDAATDEYDRNVCAQIRDEYRAYRKERLEKAAKQTP
ncbi:MAG TPA: hypothetical protein VLM11_13980 [Streptosporangiaceae bacterium]|nr:hypothetical protein [Streptosporangiaceae bacterium]